MRLPALIFAACLASAAPALAQTAPADGVTAAEARAWLTSLGGTVSEPTPAPGRTILKVADSLPWSLVFYGCADRCADAQFEAEFTGPITEAMVSEWNREQRFAKAAWIAPQAPGADAKVLLQYDVVLTESGAEQLALSAGVWKQQLGAFANYMSGALRAASGQ